MSLERFVHFLRRFGRPDPPPPIPVAPLPPKPTERVELHKVRNDVNSLIMEAIYLLSVERHKGGR